MRVLVSGATGFLGSHTARALAAAGHRVRLLHRCHSPLDLIGDLDAEHAVGDLFDPPSLEAACHRIDAVIHSAAEMNRAAGAGRRLSSHLDGTRNMLAAAGAARVGRFVYTSSVAALGFPGHAPAPDDADVVPMNEDQVWRGSPRAWRYGHAKHMAEGLVRQAGGGGMETIIVNPALVIGPGDRNRVSNLLIWQLLRGRRPPLLAGGVNVVDVTDVAAGTVAALARGRPGERYLLCGENRTLADLISVSARIVGRPPIRRRLPFGVLLLLRAAASAVLWTGIAPGLDLLRAAGLYFYYDGSKARRELGLPPPRPYEPAAAAAAAWYRGRRTGPL